MKILEITEGLESKTYDSGWKKTTGPRKDRYGNTVKNVAKHLAKKGMKQAQDDTKKGEKVDEGWGEFKSAAQRGAQAVGGALATGAKTVAGAAGRQAKDIGNTALAKMGFNRAAGKQQMQRVVGGVVNNFNRWLGQSKGKPTVAALKQYLTALGIQDPVMEVAKGARAGQARQGFDPSKRGAQQPKAQSPAQQAPATAGRKDTDELDRNEVFDIIGKNIQQAMASGTLPKEIQKFLK